VAQHTVGSAGRRPATIAPVLSGLRKPLNWFIVIFDWKLAPPMLRDIDATTEPHPIKTAHVLEELDQTTTSAGPANQPIMKAD